MKNILAVTTLTLALAAVLLAHAVVTGKWQGTARNGMQVVLDLKATGQALTGTLTRNGESPTITDGKVVRNTITFKAVLGDRTEAFTGELEGEQLRVWLDRQGPEGAIVFKRVKD